MDSKQLETFLRIAEELLQKEQAEPVFRPLDPLEVPHKLPLELNNEGMSADEWEAALRSIVVHTPRTASKRFFNQLFGGRNYWATVGELLSVLLNNSMYTYKVAGPMVHIEKETIAQLCALTGYEDQKSGGTFAPGGSMSNLMALLMARDKAAPDSREEGIQEPLVMYSSSESHYSILKNASFAGVGKKRVRLIPVNERGEMDTRALKSSIQEDKKAGLKPFFINATSGTTVLGAFDDLESCAQIAREENLWLHVDGAYCGPVLFSDTYKALLEGVSHSDSFCLNPHKMLNTPLSCSAVLVREKKYLYHSFSNEADYLYQTHGDEFNLGKISMQCGRRNEALKFWSLWKAIGTKGLGQKVDHLFDLADYARSYVKRHPDYSLYSFEPSISVCFNYKNIDASQLCRLLYEKGELMVGYGEFRGQTFVRLVLVNGQLRKEDVQRFFHILEKTAGEMELV